MKLESLNNDLFVAMEMTEAASALGGLATIAPDGTFEDCYTFFRDGTYTSNDKDQD